MISVLIWFRKTKELQCFDFPITARCLHQNLVCTIESVCGRKVYLRITHWFFGMVPPVEQGQPWGGSGKVLHAVSVASSLFYMWIGGCNFPWSTESLRDHVPPKKFGSFIFIRTCCLKLPIDGYNKFNVYSLSVFIVIYGCTVSCMRSL